MIEHNDSYHGYVHLTVHPDGAIELRAACSAPVGTELRRRFHTHLAAINQLGHPRSRCWCRCVVCHSRLTRRPRVWWLPSGAHLVTPGLTWRRAGWRRWLPVGTASDEHGRQTWWLWTPLGALVVASRGVRYPETVEVDE